MKKRVKLHFRKLGVRDDNDKIKGRNIKEAESLKQQTTNMKWHKTINMTNKTGRAQTPKQKARKLKTIIKKKGNGRNWIKEGK